MLRLPGRSAPALSLPRGGPRSVAVVMWCVAGHPRLDIRPRAGRAADRLLAGAPDPDRPICLRLDLEDRVEYRLGLGHLDRVLVPIGRFTGLWIEAADLQRVPGHQWLPSKSFPVAPSG